MGMARGMYRCLSGFVMLSIQRNVNGYGVRHVQVSKRVCDVICLKEC